MPKTKTTLLLLLASKTISASDKTHNKVNMTSTEQSSFAVKRCSCHMWLDSNLGQPRFQKNGLAGTYTHYTGLPYPQLLEPAFPFPAVAVLVNHRSESIFDWICRMRLNRFLHVCPILLGCTCFPAAFSLFMCAMLLFLVKHFYSVVLFCF